MLRKICQMVMLVMLQIHAVRAGDPPSAVPANPYFTDHDVQAAINASPDDNKCLTVESAYDGSDDNAFAIDWHSWRGKTSDAVLSFSAPGDIRRTLSGWICFGPRISDPKSIQLMLVNADTRDPISHVTISDTGEFAPFSLALPPAPLRGQVLLVIVAADPADGLAVFANVRLTGGPDVMRPPFALPAQEPAPAFPAPDLICREVRRFSGNDFDPHSDKRLDELGMNPVTTLGAEDGREIDIFVPSLSPRRTIPVVSVDDPGITSGDYAIAGQITYGSAHPGMKLYATSQSIASDTSDSEVQGAGYLEMISDFADGSYATRALADSGPMRLIHGRSGPRQFLLPFHAGDQRPTRIRLNLVMPGTGTIALTNLRLVQYVKPVPAAASISAGPSSPFFNPRFFWIAVAILPLVSLIAFLEPQIRRGRGRIVVMSWIWVWFTAGQICFAWGMAAVGHGEPIKQVGPMLLASATVWMAMLFASRRMSRRYRDAELKRMQLMDIV